MSYAQLPQTITVAGREYEIETDFRAFIAFELLATDPDMTGEEIALGALDLFFPEYTGRFLSVTTADDPALVHLAIHVEEALSALLDFYKGGTPKGKGKGMPAGKRLYDFQEDETYIYASFHQAYKIDLNEARLHWWNFKALLNALPKETVFGSILHIRAVEINSKMPKDEQSYYRKAKELYAIPERKSARQQEKEAQTLEILMGTGDLSQMK